MSSRRYGSQSLQRLLGHWQESPSRTPIWRQLAEALRLLILDGRLALDSRLPGERELAAVLQVSRTTMPALWRSCVKRDIWKVVMVAARG